MAQGPQAHPAGLLWVSGKAVLQAAPKEISQVQNRFLFDNWKLSLPYLWMSAKQSLKMFLSTFVISEFLKDQV
jgi:hypothetical protein